MNKIASFASPKAAWLDDVEFGWRARIGLIVPSRGWTPEHEWPRMLPKGVSYMVTRIPLKATTAAELALMGEHSRSAAELLGSADVDVISYGCTLETMRKGVDYDRSVQKALSEAAGKPCVTMTGAVIDAVRSFSPKRIAIVTPYIQELNDLELNFFSSIGLEVCYLKGLGISDTVEIARVSPQQVVDMGVEAVESAPDADMLLITCGNLRTIEAIPQLEAATGKPVVSSNQALIWRSLRAAGIDDRGIGVGSLFGH